MRKFRFILSCIVAATFLVIGCHNVSAASAPDVAEMDVISPNEPVIKVIGNSVEVEISDDTQHSLTVYAITGQIVKNENIESGRTIIELPRGYYIVKVDKTSTRIVIR